MPGFLPSVHGLHFANRFPAGPTLTLGPIDPRVVGFGDASAGLCGGMALTARDLWEAGIPAPGDTTPPANGSRRFRSLVRRQVESLDWLRVPLRYLDLQAMRPDPPTSLSRAVGRLPARVPAVRTEWPRIQDGLAEGHPVVVGLLRTAGSSPWRLTQNHQVLAWAWVETPTSISIRVYDPNHPRRDDVALLVDIGPGPGPWHERLSLRQSTGEPLLGFFRQPYLGPRPVLAWR